MSLTKKLKEMEEANTEQAELIVGFEASVIEKDEAIAKAKDEADTKIAELAVKVEVLEKAEVEKVEALEKAVAGKKEVSEKLQKAEAELADPAYTDAKAEGEKQTVDSAIVEEELDEKAEAEKFIKEFEAMGDKKQTWLATDDNHKKLQDAANLING